MHDLPKLATIEEACAYLAKETGKAWTLPRLMEASLMPYFWFDANIKTRPVDDRPGIFDGKPEGFLAPILFGSDTNRLAATNTFALVQMSRLPDGRLFKMTPPMEVELSELRFKREDVEETATALCKQATPESNPGKATAGVKAKRLTWLEVTGPYIVDVMKSGQYVTAKLLFNALVEKSGEGSPFDKGVGYNRGNLIVRQTAKPLSLKTLQNNFNRLKELATKTTP